MFTPAIKLHLLNWKKEKKRLPYSSPVPVPTALHRKRKNFNPAGLKMDNTCNRRTVSPAAAPLAYSILDVRATCTAQKTEGKEREREKKGGAVHIKVALIAHYIL